LPGLNIPVILKKNKNENLNTRSSYFPYIPETLNTRFLSNILKKHLLTIDFHLFTKKNDNLQIIEKFFDKTLNFGMMLRSFTLINPFSKFSELLFTAL